MTHQRPQIAGTTVMVTGGCGFIGSHLVRRLLALGAARIVVVDSLAYGARENIDDRTSAVEVVQHTLGTDPPEALRESMQGVDYLFHLAAEKHNQSLGNPLGIVRANIDGSYVLFDIAARSGVRKVVFTSSLYAYGRLHGASFREDELPEPRTIYGISKLCGEHLLRHMRAAHDLPYTVLRCLFVYGPRQFAGTGYKSVIVKNFERILGGHAPVVCGDGTQELDYVFVDDAIDAAIAALDPGIVDEVFNIGSGVGTSINDLTKRMLAVAKCDAAPEYGPADWTAGTQRVGDIAKARRLLGWKPRVSLADGLAQTYAWLADVQNRRSSGSG